MSIPASHSEACGICHSNTCQHTIQATVDKWLTPAVKLPHHLEFRRTDFAVAALAASAWTRLKDGNPYKSPDLISECWRIADAMIEEGKRREREREESGK